jgi:hypothetical protein
MRGHSKVGLSAQKPLFHVLVTLGISAGLAACGGISESSAGGSGGTGAKPEPICPASCASPSQFVCDDASNRASCRCDETRPASAVACADKYQYRCSADTPADCMGSARTGCSCDEAALTPSDCAPGQFVCEQYYPEAGSCSCDLTRPTSEAACTAPDIYFLCRSSQPYVDCRCVASIPIR